MTSPWSIHTRHLVAYLPVRPQLSRAPLPSPRVRDLLPSLIPRYIRLGRQGIHRADILDTNIPPYVVNIIYGGGQQKPNDGLASNWGHVIAGLLVSGTRQPRVRRQGNTADLQRLSERWTGAPRTQKMGTQNFGLLYSLYHFLFYGIILQALHGHNS